MKCLRVGLLATLVTALCMAGLAQAGQREGAFSLSPMVGYHVFEGDQNTDDAVAYGLSLGYNVSKRWATELEVRYTPTETQEGVASGDVDGWSAGINALYHFNPDDRLVPYISAGFGIMFFDNDGVGDNYDDNGDYMMNWGVGTKYFVNNDTALRLDLRHVLDFHSDRAWDHGGGDEVDNNFIVTAGLYWQFGGPAPPPPPPLDSDGDGIPDLRDKCPDTPLGVLVDAVGCPPAPKKEPVPVPPPVVQPPPPVVAKEIITFNLLFDFDKHNIKDEMIPALEQAKVVLNEDPETSFMVLGHTCNMGTDSYNQNLSELRAASVKSWLISNGIAAERLESIGYGETQPKYDNSSLESRKLNRRVEIQTHED